ncbi:hypothetical protein JCM8097_008113 [Rhodosporidiobolus ruineniae]
MSSESIVYDLSSLDRALPRLHSSSSSLISPTLSTLPPELKLKIARELVVHGGQSVAGNGRFPEWALEPKRDKSLSRLSKVNKEWHSLCSPFLFETFALIPTYLDDPDFLHQRILVPYAGFVKHLDIPFPHLDSVSIYRGTKDELPTLWLNSPVRILHLYTSNGCPPHPDFLKPFQPHLEQLVLAGPVMVPLWDDSDSYSLAKLTHLATTYWYSLYPSLFTTAPLTHLYLETETGEELAEFLEHHQSTLKSVICRQDYRAPHSRQTAEPIIHEAREFCLENKIELILLEEETPL